MTSITTEPFVYSGFQTGVIYELNAYGRPNAANLTAYTGIEIYATKLYSLTIPPARKIVHVGNDKALKTQQFPPLEPATGEISVGAEDLDVIAALSGASIVEIAGMQMLPTLTDLQGSEPNIGLILYQAAVAQSGAQRYHFHMITSTKAIVRLGGFGAEPIDLVYEIAPDKVDRYLWGMDMAPLADPSDPYSGVTESGALDAGIWSGFSAAEPRIASFIGDGVTKAFNFPDNMQAADITNVAVFTATGATVTEEAASGYVVTAGAVTFTVAPTNGHEVHVLYQKA